MIAKARKLDRSPWRPVLFGWSAALFLTACASNAPQKAARTEFVDTQGFTITEEVRVDNALRSDFDEAVRLMQAEQYQEGIVLLESVTSRAPAVTAAHIDLGIAYRHVDELDKAEVSLQKALDLNPRHPVAHNELGMLYRKSGRFQEARASYEQALALQPAFHYARRNLAILCDVYLADLGCALDQYEMYVEAVPDDQDAAMWVADLRNRMNQ